MNTEINKVIETPVCPKNRPEVTSNVRRKDLNKREKEFLRKGSCSHGLNIHLFCLKSKCEFLTIKDFRIPYKVLGMK